ncbi:ClpP family protease [Cytobacillus praedii]|uniref:ATP-dependent Clp protease proteolytic subunit n=1 Tax=Cytobacillus praedii TaxID=1742358 RepID=A0A4V2NTP9_9BACI|nr:ATP-dependent Clp protease proteolytic subunit [Cytobacillus praedii]TCJ01119.1 hypothetical protein E0Y62_25610 [Cytobacillus praedii]
MFFDIETKGLGLLEQIYIENLKGRRIILNEEIDSQIFDTVAMQIKKFNKEDEGKSIEDRQPIELHINSVGGSVYDGFALVSAILSSKTPVHGYCDGYVMSVGFAIYAACHKRFAGRFANFMYHEVSTMSFGKNTEIEEVTKENRRLQKMYDELITERTKLKQSKLNTVKKNKKDWFFGVDEALENGLVHEVI